MSIKYIAFSVVCIALCLCFVYFQGTPLLVDEFNHYYQIRAFYNGIFWTNPEITTIPGYHFVQYVITTLIGLETRFGQRLVNFVFSLLSLFVFYKLIEKTSSKDVINRLIQFVFLPILFPFIFMIYTDVLSLLLISLSLLYSLKRKYHVSGVFAILSMLVRQNNIIWLVFIAALSCLLEYNETGHQKMSKTIRSMLTYVFGLVLFVVFLIVNKGVSLGDVEAHPSFSFHTGNVFFMLFLFSIFFAPLILSKFKDCITRLKDDKKTIMGLLTIFVLYIFTFINDHPYNVEWGDYFLRNRILIFFTSSLIAKILFFIPILFSLIYIRYTELVKREYLMLYIFTILFFVPSWLIEQRYYIIPFSLYILYREEGSKNVEKLQSVYSVVMSLVLFYFIKNVEVFL